jgi:hypothetical protein
MPVLVDEHGELIAGHARVGAAILLELNSIPVIVAKGWSEEKKRAYRLADNQLAARLHVNDVLVDSMRGRSTNWTRIRINLRNVPEGERPPADSPEPDYDPWPAAPRA